MGSLLRQPLHRVESLRAGDRHDLARLLDADPFVNAVLASRLRALRTIEPQTFGGELLGRRDPDGRLTAAVFNGGNLLPVGGNPQDWARLARAVAERPRRCTSIVGRRAAVATMWAELEPVWGPARAVRESQPLLALGRTGAPAGGDPRVRAIRADELEAYLPAAAAMFTEELGISPYRAARRGEYRRRVAGLIAEGRAFGIVGDDGSVLFKTDLGAVTEHTCQIQGVWVRPDLRGQGLARAALAVVLRHALTLAPTVSLYVNDFNTAARRLYAGLGMTEVGELSTILF